MNNFDTIVRAKKRFYFSLCILWVAFVCLNGTLWAQEDKYSFRMRGMGEGLYGFIDDLYSDLSLNPAYIYRFKGNWIYTNLSNLQGGIDTSPFDQRLTLLRSFNAYPNNLLGAISNRFKYPIGVFLESSGYTITSDENDNSINYNTASTGISKQTRQVLFTDDGVKNFTVLGSFGDFGVSFSIYKNALNSRSESDDITSSFLVNGTTQLHENSSYLKNSALRKFEFPNSLLGFSIGRVIKRENGEISISAGRRPERMAFYENELLGLFKDQFLSGIGGEFNLPDEIGAQFITSGFRSIYVNTRLKKIYPSITGLQQNNFIVSFHRYSLPFNIDVTDNTIYDSLAVGGATRKTVTLTRDAQSPVKGNASIKRIECGAGMEKYITDSNTMIAFGIKFDYIWGNLDVTFHPAQMNERLGIKVEVGDPAEEAASYKRVISDNKTSFFKSNIKGTFLSFPAGIETKVGRNFTMRFGTQYVFSVSSNSEWESRKTDLTDTLLKTDEAHTGFVPSDGFDDSSIKRIRLNTKKTNFNSYHFGINYKFNDIVSLDILHFSKITELDTWWISLIIKN